MSSDRWHHASEPEGFAQWLGFHAGLTGTAVPEAGSDRREDLERRFSDALLAGYTVEQIRDALAASGVDETSVDAAVQWARGRAP